MRVRMSLLVAFAAFALVCARGFAAEPERFDRQTHWIRVVHAQDKLWLVSQDGALASISESRMALISEPFPGTAFDLCARDDRPVAISTSNDGSDWTLREYTSGAWVLVAAIDAKGEKLLAMNCVSDRVTLLTPSRLIKAEREGQTAVSLSGRLSRGRVGATYQTADQLFVGFYAGEWGGGLIRINQQSGDIARIEQKSGERLCGGPLNSECDPVNGIVGAPWSPDCVVVAIGLVHLSPHGRIVEVCGDRIRRIFYKPYGDGRAARLIDDEPYSTVAFFGLARSSESVWALGLDGIYELDRDGGRALPTLRFKDVGGVGVSFDIARLVLVIAAFEPCCPYGGDEPILVAR